MADNEKLLVDLIEYVVKALVDFPDQVRVNAVRGEQTTVIELKTAKEDLVKLNNGGFYAEVGGGWDHYFPFFRFTVEGKFSFGLNNQLNPTPSQNQRLYYSQSIKSLRSNIFTLSFHFE